MVIERYWTESDKSATVSQMWHGFSAGHRYADSTSKLIERKSHFGLEKVQETIEKCILCGGERIRIDVLERRLEEGEKK